MFWDEMRAVLTSSLVMLLIIMAYLFAFETAPFSFCRRRQRRFFIPLCLMARYLFRRMARAKSF